MTSRLPQRGFNPQPSPVATPLVPHGDCLTCVTLSLQFSSQFEVS